MNRQRDWLFTKFFKNDTSPEDVWRHLSDIPGVKYLTGQIEKCPETGRLHFQGFVQFEKQLRLKTIKNKIEALSNAHLEPRKGTPEQAIEYCTKEETRIAGPWEKGKVSIAGQRTDIETIVNLLTSGKTPYQVAITMPETSARYFKFMDWITLGLRNETEYQGPREVIVFQGPPGCGKSRLVREREGREHLYNLFSKSPLWFDGYQREHVLLIDEFNGEIPVEKMNELTDRKEYDIRVPVKGHSVLARWNKVYICTNTDINY